ncbi:MAG: hypothetical protein Q4D29_13415, partial [Lachnospiraceae bacterium]|nr:hypothetical protein [Lachnospiraceae bacterium]
SYLDADHGLCVSQESMMILLLDPTIAGWSLKQVDAVRKAIAKKKRELYDKMTEEFNANIIEKGLSEKLCRYVWDVLIAPQRSYSFCSAHGLAYSLVALQEMNLACNYPSIFWNTANLIADSAGADIDDDDDDEEANDTSEEDVVTDGEEDLNAQEKVKRAERTVDYGRT